MQKVLNTALVLLLALFVAVSCSPESPVEETVSVTLIGTNDKIDLNGENLTWKYTVQKADGTSTVSEEAELINGKTSPLTLGEWNITLYGYSGKNLVCKGGLRNYTVSKASQSVEIAVELSQKATGKITVSSDVKMTGTDGQTVYSLANGYNMKVTIADKDGKTVSETTHYAKSTSGLTETSVKSGSYKVTVAFYNAELTATCSKSVEVYDYLTTTVSGTLNGIVIKADTEKGSTEATTKIDESIFVEKTDATTGKKVVENSDTVEIVAPITAVEEGSETTTEEAKQTTVAFPAGALKKSETQTTEAVTLSVKTASAKAVAEETTDFKVESSDAVVAGFEFNLTGADSSDLSTTVEKEDGTTEKVGVTVTTFISKGLGDKEDLQIKYLGTNEGDDPEIVSYNTETGELVFTVYHFSKYAIVSSKMVAMDEKGNMYTSLENAITAVSDGTAITLLKDITVTSLSVSKNVTVNLANKTITLNNTVTGGEAVNITGSAVLALNNGKVKGSATNNAFTVRDNAKLVLDTINMEVTCLRGVQLKEQSYIGKLALNDSTIIVKDGYYAVATNATVVNGKTAEVEIDIVESTLKTITDNAEDDNTALLSNVPGKITITDSHFEGGRQGAIMRCGTYTVTGSDFKYRTKDKNDTYETSNWKDGNNVPHGAIVIGNRTASAYESSVSVAFNGTNTLYAPEGENQLYVYQNSEEYTATVTGSVDENWKVNTDMHGANYPTAVAKIGNYYYESLASAVTAAQKYETITLLKDTALTKNVDIATYLTLDLNGKTLSYGEGGSISLAHAKGYCCINFKNASDDQSVLAITNAVAKIGAASEFDGAYFMTLTSAHQFVGYKIEGNVLIDGNTISLLANVKLSSTWNISKEVILDLNGHSIIDSERGRNPSKNTIIPVIKVNQTTGDLTIKGEGTIKSDALADTEKDKNCGYYAISVENAGARVTIENGTFIGNDHAVYVFNGTATINGGYFKVESTSYTDGKEYNYVLNCYNENYTAETAKMTVTGGSFENFNPYWNGTDAVKPGDDGNFVAEGYGSVKISEESASPVIWKVQAISE